MNAASILALVATAVAWLGAGGATLLRYAGARFMRPLVLIALLVFALIATFDILPESKRALTWPIFVGSVGVGYCVFWLIGRYVAPICPACAIRHFEEEHRHSPGLGLAFLALVLSTHCFVDGLGVSAASKIEAGFALRVFAAIALHKLPEGFALGLVLMTGTRSALIALAIATGIETSTLTGAVAGAFWMNPSAFWLAIVLAHVGGTFLYSSVSGLQDALAPRVAQGVGPPLTQPSTSTN